MPEPRSELVSHIESLDPKSREFADALEAMARKVVGLRRKEGKVPYNLFLSSSELQGLSQCIEVIVLDKVGNLYLRRRESAENVSEVEERSWGGKLHIPGATIFPAKRFEMNLYGLLEREVVGGEGRDKRVNLANLYRESKTVGVVLLPQPERRSDALKVYMQIVVDDPGILREGYEKVTKENIGEVIDEHKPVVEKILNKKNGPFLFDTRRMKDVKIHQ